MINVRVRNQCVLLHSSVNASRMVTHLHVVDWCISLRRACTLPGKVPHLTGCIFFKQNKCDTLPAPLYVQQLHVTHIYLLCVRMLCIQLHRKGTVCSIKKKNLFLYRKFLYSYTTCIKLLLINFRENFFEKKLG